MLCSLASCEKIIIDCFVFVQLSYFPRSKTSLFSESSQSHYSSQPRLHSKLSTSSSPICMTGNMQVANTEDQSEQCKLDNKNIWFLHLDLHSYAEFTTPRFEIAKNAPGTCNKLRPFGLYGINADAIHSTHNT